MRRIKFLRIISLIWIISLIGIIKIQSVSAQSLSLSISPPVLEVLIKPGKSITQAYKISNDGDPIILIPRLMKYTENGIEEETNTPDWITLINIDLALDRPFLLKSKEARQLILRVAPLKGTEDKDYYYALVFSSKPNPPSNSSESSIAQNLASPIIISVSSTGLMDKQALVTQFTLPGIIDSLDPLEVDMEVKNMGKNYFRPVGKISLTGPIGQANFNIVPNIILTGQKRLILTENPTNREGKTISLPGLYLGKYTVEANFALDEGTTKIVQVKNFYAVPWKAGVILIILIIILLKLKRKKKKTK